MASIKLFAIMDKKSHCFQQPFPASHIAEVARGYTQHIREGKGNIAQFPEDFALYLVGDFDTDNGEILSERPVHLLELSSLVKPIGGQIG